MADNPAEQLPEIATSTNPTQVRARVPAPRAASHQLSRIGVACLATIILTTVVIGLSASGGSGTAKARTAVISVVTNGHPIEAIQDELDGLASSHEPDALANAVTWVGQDALRVGESTEDPATAADAFLRAAACYEYLARESPDLLEIAADALDQAGDLHCELGQTGMSQKCHRRSHAHFTTLLTQTETTPEALARFADKQKLAARYMINTSCP